MTLNLHQALLRAPLAVSVALSAAFISTTPVTHAATDEDRAAQEGEAQLNSSKFAIAPVVFRDGSTHMRVLDNVNGTAIAEGDIIFGDAKTFFNQSANNRSIRGLSNHRYGAVWPNGVVPYRISEGLSDASKEKVRSAIDSWNNTGAVTLIERTDATASAYPHYVDFVQADQCASWVGFQNNGAQSIYTGDRCSAGSMIHEIGHALGLLHEHTRPDRDNFISINWNSIATDKSHNFDILEDAIVLGEYDYDSIMHYGTHFFSKDGAPTITALQNTSSEIGQRERISDGDRSSMIELYTSEYSLVASSAESVVAGGTIQLDMFVTNNSDVGANTMRLETTVPPGTSLISFSSQSWACQQGSEGDDVVCFSPVLTEGQSSDVSLSLSAPESPGNIDFDTTLSANTFDADKSNNRDSTSTTVVDTANDLTEEPKAPVESQPAFAAATPAPASAPTPASATTPASAPTQASAPTPASAPTQASVPTVAAASSGGGGAFGLMGIMLLLTRRRAAGNLSAARK